MRCSCSQVHGFGSLPRSGLNLILQFEACRQLFNTKSQAVIFSLRATIPFTSQMPNYSLHLISVPWGDSRQGRAAAMFKIGYIRLTVITFVVGRVMKWGESRQQKFPVLTHLIPTPIRWLLWQTFLYIMSSKNRAASFWVWVKISKEPQWMVVEVA